MLGCAVNAALIAASLGAALAVSEWVLARYEAELLRSLAVDPAHAMDQTGWLVDMDPVERERQFSWRSDGSSLAHIKSPNPKLVYELRPSTRIGGMLETNAHGFRDYAFSTEKPDGVYRICVAGDSITLGWYQRAEDTYPKVLEALLNADAPPGRRYEVYNMGVGGYNAEQEFEVIKTKMPPFHPDLILVGYCVNDNLIGGDAGLWRHFTRSRLRTWDFIKLRWMQMNEGLDGNKMIDRVYRALAAWSRETGIPVHIVNFWNDKDEGIGQEIQETRCQAAGLPYLRLMDIMQAEGADRVFEEDGIHPSVIGHRIAAEAIYRYLKENVPGL